jgi:hypothetical protein
LDPWTNVNFRNSGLVLPQWLINRLRRIKQSNASGMTAVPNVRRLHTGAIGACLIAVLLYAQWRLLSHAGFGSETG